MTQVLHLSSRWNKFLVSLLISIQSFCFRWWKKLTSSFWDVWHKPIISLFFSLLVFQQLRYNLLGRVLSKLICGGSWHFPSPFCYSNDRSSILSSGGIVRFLALTHLVWARSCYFLAYPFNRSVVFSFKFFHLIKFCLSFQPDCCLKSFLPLVPSFQ